MATLIARVNYGGIDLYNGCPDLRDATIVKIDTEKNAEEYKTMLTIRDKKRFGAFSYNYSGILKDNRKWRIL